MVGFDVHVVSRCCVIVIISLQVLLCGLSICMCVYFCYLNKKIRIKNISQSHSHLQKYRVAVLLGHKKNCSRTLPSQEIAINDDVVGLDSIITPVAHNHLMEAVSNGNVTTDCSTYASNAILRKVVRSP